MYGLVVYLGKEILWVINFGLWFCVYLLVYQMFIKVVFQIYVFYGYGILNYGSDIINEFFFIVRFYFFFKVYKFRIILMEIFVGREMVFFFVNFD